MLITIETAKAIASLTAIADNKDDNLNKVFVAITADTITATASDRYLLAQFTDTNNDGLAAANFVISPQQAKAILASKSRQPVAVERTDDNTTISIDGLTIITTSKTELADRLPEMVKTLEPTDDYTQATPLCLDLDRLAQLTKLLTPTSKPDKITAWQVFTAQPTAEKRAKPIKLTAGKFVAYLQPRMGN